MTVRYLDKYMVTRKFIFLILLFAIDFIIKIRYFNINPCLKIIYGSKFRPKISKIFLEKS